MTTAVLLSLSLGAIFRAVQLVDVHAFRNSLRPRDGATALRRTTVKATMAEIPVGDTSDSQNHFVKLEFEHYKVNQS